MLINGEEIFRLEYSKIPGNWLVYAPLRSRIILVSDDVAYLLFNENSSCVQSSLLTHIRKNPLVNTNLFSKDFNAFKYRECRDCFCKFHCAGNYPDKQLNGDSKCALIKELFTIKLNSYYENKVNPQTQRSEQWKKTYPIIREKLKNRKTLCVPAC